MKTIKEKAKEYAESISQSKERRKYCKEDFIAGAEWMYDEFEKNRLAACDNQTEEECGREQKFVDEFINKNHRIPTISDAIEITREQMIEKACKWLKDILDYCEIDCRDEENFLNDFKEAMKGGKE